MWRGSSLKTIIITTTVFSLVLSCMDDNCIDCDTYINSGGTLAENCFSCDSGYIFNDQGRCVKDTGLIIGIAIGAAAAILAQILCYVYCKIKYGDPRMKRSDLNLQEIYGMDSEDASNKSEENKIKEEGPISGPISIANNNQQNAESMSDSIGSEFKIFIKRQCGICRGDKTSIKTLCGHYFHHVCFQEEMKKTSSICPYKQCGKRTLSPIEMMCIKCLNKKREVPLESYSNFDNFKDFICIVCRMKIRKEEEKKKWWKRYF